MPSILTDHDRSYFRQVLKKRYYELREEVRQELLKYDEQHYIDIAERVHDLEEESVADLLVDLELADIDRHIQEIRDIDAALIRLADGSYGVCLDCNGEIDIERLKVFPTAKRCIQCQAMYEKTHIHPTQSSL